MLDIASRWKRAMLILAHTMKYAQWNAAELWT